MSQPTKPFTLESKKRSRSTEKQSKSAVESLYAQYVSDLRVLLDQGHAREQKLFELLSERTAKAPVVSIQSGPRIVPDVDPNEMSDVANFDEEADAEQMKKDAVIEKELEQEFNDIWNEQFSEEPAANAT